MADAAPPVNPVNTGAIPATTPASFPAATSNGVQAPAATGPTPSLVPNVGSTNPGVTPPTNIPGTTAPPPMVPPAQPHTSAPAPSSNFQIPNASTAPITPAPTIAPVGNDELVSGQMEKLLKQGSPYLDLAKSQSQQSAAARGMQNSSIAAGAGEAAAIAAAQPIAAADAATNSARTSANLAAENQFGFQAQASQNQINQIVAQGSVTERLNAQQNAFSAMINAINNGHQLTLADKNFQNQLALTVAAGNINSSLSAQQSKQQIDQINATSADTIKQINAQAAATASQYGPALQSQYLQGVATIMQATTTQIASIYSTQGLTAQQQANAVAVAQRQMQENIKQLQAYYASSPLWLTGQQPAPIPGAPPGTGTPNAGPPIPLVPPAGPTSIPGHGGGGGEHPH